MSIPKGFRGLDFPCECVSAKNKSYSDPWAEVAKNRLLPDGTKEEILNLVAREPKTISQLAAILKLSAPSVHTHVTDMMKSELLRESEEWERKYPAERYYEPNFPVIGSEESAEFETVCEEMAKEIAELFEKYRPQLEQTFDRTELKKRGWDFSDLSQYFYARAQRGARQILENRAAIQPAEKHDNGIRWVFWAEEPTDENG
jgi:DNA-binding transcriptional ArsR family regulator